jgi:hypothetical protein
MDLRPASLKHLAVATLGLLCGMTGSANAQISDVEDTYQFLVSGRNSGKGALYRATAGDLSGALLPLSFYDSSAYWGLYVCVGEKFPCVVTDIYDSTSFTLKPDMGVAGDLQTERVNVHNGTNIYDAATWQIAVVLGDVLNKFRNQTKQSGWQLAESQNKLLSLGYNGNAKKLVPHAIRADTRGGIFAYNGRTVALGPLGYAFRMIPRDWLSTDPLSGSMFDAWITAKELPPVGADYRRGKVTWADWKPVTGENAWAFLLGPLHSAYVHYILDERKTSIPYHDLAIQNALAVLPTFAAMQAPVGAVYYAPSGTLSNQGTEIVSRYQVSVENNFSLYAGLIVLRETLNAVQRYDNSLTRDDKAVIRSALNTITVMINGGRVAQNEPTEGLLAFFKTKAWRDGEFVQGGLANDPNEKAAWVPSLDPKAVDVTTWGISALGAKKIDEWFGSGTAIKSWEQLKTWGAYGTGKSLWGVGYSNKDGNGVKPDGTYRQGILSAEWTAGAINMLRGIIHYYSKSQSALNSAEVAADVAKLKEDEAAMLKGVQTLRFNNYVKAQFPGSPPNYYGLISQSSGSYLYASKRYLIPFGWYANPIPSTCSTAWIIMLANDFDPFRYRGKRG